MDFTTLGYCPHVITEARKDAELYCNICAPQVITALRMENDLLLDAIKKVMDAPNRTYEMSAVGNLKAVYKKILAEKE